MTRLLLAIAFVTLLPWPALAESISLRCFPTAFVEGFLLSDYGELPIGRGLDNDGWLTELYASQDGSTWTVVVTPSPDKRCLMLTGEAWQSLSPEWKAKGDPL